MNFKTKSFIYKILDKIPNNGKIGYFFSKLYRRLTSKTLENDQNFFDWKFDTAIKHFTNFNKHNRLTNNSFKYFEFGAGNTLTIPITINRLGFEVQCIDIRNIAIPDLIKDSISKIENIRAKTPYKLLDFPENINNNFDILLFLKNELKLNYTAPKDAKTTGFDSEYFDFISSTLVMTHIPKSDLELILSECFRILKKGGIISATIDYLDCWSSFDKNISPYNYLKFSEIEWRKYNPSLHFQNRLRHKDYLELFINAGFEIVETNFSNPDKNDFEKLKSINIDSSFSKYSLDELAIKNGEIVARKPL